MKAMWVVLLVIGSTVLGTLGCLCFRPPQIVEKIKEVDKPRDVVKIKEVEKIVEVTAQPTTTYISAKALFEGKLTVDEVTVAGTVNGTLDVKQKILVAKGGRLNAEVKTGEITVEGQVVGNLSANTVFLLPTSVVHGDLAAGTLSISPGAIYHGKVAVGPEAIKAALSEKIKATLDEPKREIVMHIPMEIIQPATTKITKTEKPPKEEITPPKLPELPAPKVPDPKPAEPVARVETNKRVYTGASVREIAFNIVTNECPNEWKTLVEETKKRFSTWKESTENDGEFATFIHPDLVATFLRAKKGAEPDVKRILMLLALFKQFNDLTPVDAQGVYAPLVAICESGFSWDRVCDAVKKH